MSESLLRATGAATTVVYALFIGWLATQQPQSFAEVTGGLAASFGTYEIDAISFEEGLQLFRSEQFPAARQAWARADPAGRDPRTQFYVAYSFYRQGWGRTSHDDALYRDGLEALERGMRSAANGRIAVNDPDLAMHSADELKAELEAGVTRELSDFNPLRLLRERK